MINILYSTWFNSMEGTIGMVVMKNAAGEVKAYIGRGDGVDEKADAERIARHGAPVSPLQLIDALKELSKGLS